jgi:hypothetical protein
VAQLAEEKGLPVELLKGMGWFDTNWFGIPAVGIPYPNGALRYWVRFTSGYLPGHPYPRHSWSGHLEI